MVFSLAPLSHARLLLLLFSSTKTADLLSHPNSGVAVGSSIGHAIGGFFGGSSSEAQPSQQQGQDAYAQPIDNNGFYNAQNQTAAGGYGGAAAQDQPCMTDVKNFTRCMDENQGNMGICGWYMEQLKACQQAARPY